MPAITNKGELASAVVDFMADATDLTAPMDVIIMQAEQMIFHGVAAAGATMEPLRCRDMETQVALPATGGRVTLPDDYLQWRRVVENGGGVVRGLQPIAPQVAEQMYASRPQGPADHFVVIGNFMQTFPGTANDITLQYYAKPPSLAAAADGGTNAILAKYPMLYLKGCQAAAAEWLKDYSEMQAHMGLLKGLVGGLNREGQMDALAKAPLIFRRQIR